MPAAADDLTYTNLLEAIPLDAQELIKFQFPAEAQMRLSELLDMNRAGKLEDGTRNQLERYLAAEALVRVLKAKALLAAARKS